MDWLFNRVKLESALKHLVFVFNEKSGQIGYLGNVKKVSNASFSYGLAAQYDVGFGFLVPDSIEVLIELLRGGVRFLARCSFLGRVLKKHLLRRRREISLLRIIFIYTLVEKFFSLGNFLTFLGSGGILLGLFRNS